MEENTTYTSTLFNNETPNRQKVLGVSWDPASDMLEFDIRSMVSIFSLILQTFWDRNTSTRKHYATIDQCMKPQFVI